MLKVRLEGRLGMLKVRLEGRLGMLKVRLDVRLEARLGTLKVRLSILKVRLSTLEVRLEEVARRYHRPVPLLVSMPHAGCDCLLSGPWIIGLLIVSMTSEPCIQLGRRVRMLLSPHLGNAAPPLYIAADGRTTVENLV